MMSASSSVGSVDKLMNELDEMINFEDGDDNLLDAPAPAIEFSKDSSDIGGEEENIEEGNIEEGEKEDMLENIKASLHEEEPEDPSTILNGSGGSFGNGHSQLTPHEETQNANFVIDATAASDLEPVEDQVAAAKANVAGEDQGAAVIAKDEAEDQVEAAVTNGDDQGEAADAGRRRWFWRSASAPPAKLSPDSERGESTHSTPEGTRTRPRQPKRVPRPVSQIGTSLRNLRDTAAAVDYIEEAKRRAKEMAMDPESIVASQGCRARTLSISDHHATILLTKIIPRRVKEVPTVGENAADLPTSPESVRDFPSDDNMREEPEIVRALLKLTLAPFHKASLGRKPMTAGDYLDQKFTIEELDASAEILAFLSQYKFSLTSDSGAEYSYYDAIPARAPPPRQREIGEVGLVGSLNKALHGFAVTIGGDVAKGAESNLPIGNENGTRFLGDSMFGGFRVELIAPASDQQIRLEMPKPSASLVKETPELYDAVTRPYIEEIVSGDSLEWIQDIVDGKKCTNGILLENEEYFLHIDTEWRSHPDPRLVPPEEWFEHSSVADLHIIGMLKQGGVASLRDLRGEHIPFLKAMLNEGIRMIHRVYGVDADQIRVFVPYPPQFFRFHMYYTRIDYTSNCSVEKVHLVDDIIQNLEMDPDFYAKRTISYKIRVTDDLYKRIWLHEVSSETEDGLVEEPVESDFDY